MKHCALIPHPGTGTPLEYRVSSALGLEADTRNGRLLVLTHKVEGPIADVTFTRPQTGKGAGHRRDNLWQATCFEAFFNLQGHTDYVEVNIAPQGDWALYGFSDYRTDMTDRPASAPPQITVTPAENSLTVKTVLRLQDCLPHRPAEEGGPPAGISGRALRVGLAAIIEEPPGNLTYWATHHPAESPDFHHTDGFTVQLTI